MIAIRLENKELKIVTIRLDKKTKKLMVVTIKLDTKTNG